MSYFLNYLVTYIRHTGFVFIRQEVAVCGFKQREEVPVLRTVSRRPTYLQR